MQLRARDLIDRAKHWKGLHTLAPTTTRLAAPGPITTREAMVRRLADDMIDLAAAGGAAVDTALLNRGWSTEALRKYGDAARDLANHMVMRRSA